MFHPLPFATFGEVAHLGLEAHVSCSRCYSSRRISLDDDRLRARQFAGTRFRCTNERWNGEVCGGLGSLKIQPAELLPVGGANTLTESLVRPSHAPPPDRPGPARQPAI